MKKQQLIPAIVLTLLFSLLLNLGTFQGVFQGLDNLFYDGILQSEQEVNPKIIIVGLDDTSIEALGQWPWPRSYISNVLDKLVEMKVAAVGVDVLYDTPGSDEENDSMLMNSIATNSDKIVLASFGVFPESVKGDKLEANSIVKPFSPLDEYAQIGHINVMPDEYDGVLRKAFTSIYANGEQLDSFPLMIYRSYCRSLNLDDKLDIPVDRWGKYVIDFKGKPNSYTTLSFSGILNDEYPVEIFEDAIVLIGPYCVGIGQDAYYTPLGRQQEMYGVEFHANTIQNLLEKSFKKSAPFALNLVFLLFFAVCTYVLCQKVNPIISAIIVVALIGVEILIYKMFYENFGMVLTCSYAVVLLALLYITHLAYKFFSSQQEKRHIQGLFGRFVAPEVVDEIMNGNVSVELGGTLREVTVLFVDIRGFTAFSEVTPPEIVVKIVNKYLNLTSTSILNNRGTLDKYIGDATMAMFNAPNLLEDHPFHAVMAAWDMQQGAVAIQKEIFEEYNIDLKFGIGINTGQAIVGNIGSEFRMDYTVIGDTVNTAARLEGSAKQNEIIISQAVYDRVQDKIEATCLGGLMVKNKKTELTVYRVEKILE